MNLKECYIKFGGDFDEVLGRLRREQTVQKFVYKDVYKRQVKQSVPAAV